MHTKKKKEIKKTTRTGCMGNRETGKGDRRNKRWEIQRRCVCWVKSTRRDSPIGNSVPE
jgi:hypothetical protein